MNENSGGEWMREGYLGTEIKVKVQGMLGRADGWGLLEYRARGQEKC